MDSLKTPPYSDCTVLTSHDLRGTTSSSSWFQRGEPKKKTTHIMETKSLEKHSYRNYYWGSGLGVSAAPAGSCPWFAFCLAALGALWVWHWQWLPQYLGQCGDRRRSGGEACAEVDQQPGEPETSTPLWRGRGSPPDACCLAQLWSMRNK